MKLATTCTVCNKQRKSKNLSYHPETLQPYCNSPHECTSDHPNSIYTVAERGSVQELLTYRDASEELKKRVDHFVANNELPFITQFLHDYAGKSFSTKLDTQMLTRLARYIEKASLQSNVSEGFRRLLAMGLDVFEAHNMLESNIKVTPVPDIEELKPVPKPEEEKKANITGTGVPVPVRRATPADVPNPYPETEESETPASTPDEWVL